MDTIELNIDGIAAGGEGVGRCEGKVYFVPGSAPGDRLRARPGRDGGSWARAEIVEIIEAGPGRIEAPCPLAGSCGGCQFQHLDAETERDAKLAILADSLQRIGGLDCIPAIRFESSPEFAYRRRARLHGRTLAGDLELGFLAAASHELVPQEGCPLLEEPLQNWVDAFRAHLAGRLRELFTFQAEFTLLEGGALELLLRVESRVGEKVLEALKDWTGPAPIHLTLRALERQRSYQEAAGAPFLLETLRLEPEGRAAMEIRQFTRPGDFIQVNRLANRRMITRVLEQLERPEGSWILDLFAGAGNLTLPLAMTGAKVLGVEEGRGAIRSARRAARENRVARARFKTGRVADLLPQLVEDQRRYRSVVLDPPRTGAPELADWLDPLGVEEILSLSCDPGTLSRDLKAWTAKGFRLEALHLFDFFPQTRHLESLAVLRR